MNRFKHLVLRGLLTTSLLAPQLLLAHAALTSAAPAHGDVLVEAPEKLVLEFNEDVQLLKLSLLKADHTEVAIDFMPAPSAAKQFSITLPEIGEGSYTARWVILGADSHRVEDTFVFVVDADATPVSNTSSAAPDAHGGEHGH